MEKELAVAAPNRRITVRAPAEIVFNLEKALDIQRQLLGRLGCRGCTSGFDIRFILENEFVVDAAGKLHSLGVEGA